MLCMNVRKHLYHLLESPYDHLQDMVKKLKRKLPSGKSHASLERVTELLPLSRAASHENKTVSVFLDMAIFCTSCLPGFLLGIQSRRMQTGTAASRNVLCRVLATSGAGAGALNSLG